MENKSVVEFLKVIMSVAVRPFSLTAFMVSIVLIVVTTGLVELSVGAAVVHDRAASIQQAIRMTETVGVPQ